MKRLAVILLNALMILFSEKAAQATASASWESMGVKKGITLFKQEIFGSPVLAFKGTSQIDAPIEKVATVIFDCAHASEWVPHLAESHIVRWNSPTQYVEYDHIGTPFIMKDRDFVSLVNLEVDAKVRSVTFRYRALDAPEIPSGKLIRGDLIASTYTLTATTDNRTLFSGEIHADPKGSVPKWIVNLFQREWPVDALTRLKERVKKSDITIDPHFAALSLKGKQ